MTEKTEEKMLMRGKRAMAIRNAFGLSRRKFAELSEIPLGTLQNWEGNRHGGMNDFAAQRLVQAFSEHLDVIVTEEWLLEGIGAPPLFPNLLIHQSLDFNSSKLDIDEKLSQQLSLFQKLHPNNTYLQIKDDLMAPIYLNRDWVAGISLTNSKLEADQIYIVTLPDGEQVVRILNMNSENHFNLIAFANGKNVCTHQDVQPKKLARVIWTYRQNS